MLTIDQRTILRGIWRSGRPHTGLFAFLLCIYGFATHNMLGLAAIVAGLTFCLGTMSIMRYNDLVDAPNDRRKGRFFATEHRQIITCVWFIEAIMIATGLVWLAIVSPHLSLFLGTVWLVGLGYSHIPHWFITQNIIVAICSGAPVFCAAIYTLTVDSYDWFTFLLFTSLIWLSEVHKDIEDAKTDLGYKETWATRRGITGAMLLLVPSLHIAAAFFFWHPNVLLQLIALTLVPKMAYEQALHLLGRITIARPMQTMKLVIKASGVALFFPILFT